MVNRFSIHIHREMHRRGNVARIINEDNIQIQKMAHQESEEYTTVFAIVFRIKVVFLTEKRLLLAELLVIRCIAKSELHIF